MEVGTRTTSQSSPAAQGSVTARPNRILMHCPELTLKGRNYIRLQRRLCANVEHRLSSEGIAWSVKSAYGRVYVEIESHASDEVQRAVSALEETPGVASVAPAVWLPPSRTRQHRDDLDWPLLEETSVALAGRAFAPERSFAVRVNRADQRVSTTAPTMEARLGDAIRRHTDWDRVDLDEPDQTFFVDVYADGMFFYSGKRKGVAGMPVGASGKVICLLSGGIDSPVAAYMLAKRGCSLELFHMSANFIDAASVNQSVVGELARRISRFTLRTRLWAAPYVHFDLALPERDRGYALVLFRRFLLRTAEALAQRIGARALATGDSLGQVASQTLDNMIAASGACDMTVLRPLVGLNKEEIMAVARAIDTFDTSIQPYKDCCALLSKNPRTRSSHGALAVRERRLVSDYDRLIKRTLDDALCLSYECGRHVDASPARVAPREGA